MIKDESIAKEVSELMLEFGARLDASLIAAQPQLSEDEFHWYRRAVGHVLAPMLLEIMNPLYRVHPDLKPPELK